jgi:hypothetical protein
MSYEFNEELPRKKDLEGLGDLGAGAGVIRLSVTSFFLRPDKVFLAPENPYQRNKEE